MIKNGHDSSKIDKWALIILAVGVLLRARQYLFNRSLWLDEAMLALNISGKNALELTKPLSRDQAAPIGFLLITKWVTILFGMSEYALRALPFICGIGALFVFNALAKRVLELQERRCALCMMAVSQTLIFYSSEFKPYGCDCLVTTVLACLLLPLIQGRLKIWHAFALAAAGALSIWLSFPSVFTLGGIGVVLLWSRIEQKNHGELRVLLPIIAVWLASFGFYYLFALHSLTHVQTLTSYWQDGFMPFPPVHASDATWYIQTFYGAFEAIAGLHKAGNLLPVLFAVGLILSAKRNAMMTAALSLPIGLALFASAMKKYPFADRLALFCVPYLLIFASMGLVAVCEVIGNRSKAAAIVFVALAFFQPLNYAFAQFICGYQVEETRELVKYVAQNAGKDDTVFVFGAAVPAFEYYEQRLTFPGVRVILDEEKSIPLESVVKSGRVWVLFSHFKPDERSSAMAKVSQSTRHVLAKETTGACLDVFEPQ